MKDKIFAFAIHLLCSFVLITLCVGFVLWHFYPHFLFDIEDTIAGLKILIPVDIILGPILTGCIYKKGKWGLKFDLTFIIICQVMALSYGCWALYASRPGFLVFYGKTFFIAPPKIDQTSLKDTSLFVGKWDSPQMIFLDIPGDASQRISLAFQSFSEGVPIQWQAKYFSAFKNISADDLEKASIPLERLRSRANKKRAKLEALIAGKAKLSFIETIGSRKRKVTVVNNESKDIIAILDIDP